MKPQENLQPYEAIEETSTEAMPSFDASADYNGMYDSKEEFLAAEAAYKIEPAVDLNTITFAADNPEYPIATMEDVAAMNDSIEVETETAPDELTETGFENLPTADLINAAGGDEALRKDKEKDIIDVEARDVSGEDIREGVVDLEQEQPEAFIDLEDPDDITDIETLFDSTDKIKTAEGELALTPKLKALSKNVFGFMNGMFSDPQADLPETVDWNLYLATEDDIGEVHDYPALLKFYNAQYKRKLAKLEAGKLLEKMRAPWDTASGGAPPEPPSKAGAEAAPQNPEANTNSEAVAEGETLKIEMDKPEGGTETPQLEYAGAVPALTYEPDTKEGSPAQGNQKQITQQ